MINEIVHYLWLSVEHLSRPMVVSVLQPSISTFCSLSDNQEKLVLFHSSIASADSRINSIWVLVSFKKKKRFFKQDNQQNQQNQRLHKKVCATSLTEQSNVVLTGAVREVEGSGKQLRKRPAVPAVWQTDASKVLSWTVSLSDFFFLLFFLNRWIQNNFIDLHRFSNQRGVLMMMMAAENGPLCLYTDIALKIIKHIENRQKT